MIFTSFDALILDGQGISSVIARLFDDAPLPPIALPSPAVTASAQQRQADATYWQAKLQDITTPSALPWRTPLATIKSSRYRRASLTLPREVLKQFSRLGSAHALLRNSSLSALSSIRWRNGPPTASFALGYLWPFRGRWLTQ